MREYADEWAESCGLYALAEQFGSPYVVVDIEMLERELFTVPSDTWIYLFDPNS